MRFRNRFFAFVVLALLAVSSAFGAITATTLSAAVSTTYETTYSLTSPTGFAVGYTAIVDKEAVTILAVSGSNIKVLRGAAGTRAATHVSGAVIYAGPSNEVSTELKIQFGKATLNGATPSVAAVTGLAAYNSTASFKCASVLEGAAASTVIVVIAYTSTTAITFTGTAAATAVVDYICVGF